MSGSANWSLFAFSGDEQVQTITSRPRPCGTRGLRQTWRQGSSHMPGFGIKGPRAA